MSALDDLETPPVPGALLDRTDLASPTWRKLKTHMEARRDELRTRNDNTALDQVATAALRGEIKAYRNLLALGSPSPAVVVADEELPE